MWKDKVVGGGVRCSTWWRWWIRCKTSGRRSEREKKKKEERKQIIFGDFYLLNTVLDER